MRCESERDSQVSEGTCSFQHQLLVAHESLHDEGTHKGNCLPTTNELHVLICHPYCIQFNTRALALK